MEQPAIVERLARLEEKVSQLEASPVSTLRTEMNTGFAEVRAEFAEVRAEVRAEFAEVRAEVRAEFAEVRAEFAEFRAEVRQQFEAIDGRFGALEAKLDTGLEDTRRYMRILYEDLVTRIATIGEGPGPQRAPRKRR